MAARGPQNGRRGLERGLPLDFELCQAQVKLEVIVDVVEEAWS